jgi:hypothetical protein
VILIFFIVFLDELELFIEEKSAISAPFGKTLRNFEGSSEKIIWLLDLVLAVRV